MYALVLLDLCLQHKIYFNTTLAWKLFMNCVSRIYIAYRGVDYSFILLFHINMLSYVSFSPMLCNLFSYIIPFFHIQKGAVTVLFLYIISNILY